MSKKNIATVFMLMCAFYIQAQDKTVIESYDILQKVLSYDYEREIEYEYMKYFQREKNGRPVRQDSMRHVYYKDEAIIFESDSYSATIRAYDYLLQVDKIAGLVKYTGIQRGNPLGRPECTTPRPGASLANNIGKENKLASFFDVPEVRKIDEKYSRISAQHFAAADKKVRDYQLIIEYDRETFLPRKIEYINYYSGQVQGNAVHQPLTKRYIKPEITTTRYITQFINIGVPGINQGIVRASLPLWVTQIIRHNGSVDLAALKKEMPGYRFEEKKD